MLLIIFHESTMSLPLMFGWLMCIVFRELKCMDLVTGLKFLNMLEQKEDHNVLTTIMLCT